MDRLKPQAYLAVDCFGYRVDGKLWSFFSTIGYHLEKQKWGSVYPIIMLKLCDEGYVEPQDLPTLRRELTDIQKHFDSLIQQDIVLDYDSLESKLNFSKKEQKLPIMNYFVNERGRTIFDVFFKAIQDATELESKITIKVFPGN